MWIVIENKIDSWDGGSTTNYYNEIEKICNEKKYKYVLFSGDIQLRGRYFVSKWIKRLIDFTGFNYRKITRHNLRP